MKNRDIPRIPKWWPAVAAVLILALLPRIATTGEKRDRQEAFIKAAGRGDLAAVKKLLAEGAEVDGAHWYDKRRALPYAAAKGRLEVVRLLLENGADVDATDQDCLTPLMNACEEGRPAIARLLLDKGADVNAQTKYGSTALRKAVQNQYPQIVRLLLDRDADVNGKLNDGSFVLMSAAMTGNTELVKELLQKGADVNAKDENGSSALTWAAVADRSDVVKLLKARGAQSDLWVAALTGDTDEVKRFIDGGADVNAADGQGWTPLMNAARKGHVDVVKLLLDKGANPAAKRCGRTPVVEAALSGGSPGILAVLTNRGPGVVATGTQQWPLLATACKWGRAQVVKLLLAKGFEVNATGREGISLLMIASAAGQIEVAKVLLDNGADVNQWDDEGKTALSRAAARGELELVKLLLDNGANVNAVDKRGRSALSCSREGPIAELLKAHGANGDNPAAGHEQSFAIPSFRWSAEFPEFRGGCIAPAPPSKTIRLDLMEVTIRLKSGTYSVDAVYHFFNSGETATVMVAVPKEVWGNSEWVTSSAAGGIRDFPRFVVWVNGRKTEFEEVCDLSAGRLVHIVARHLRRFWYWGQRAPTRWMTEDVTFARKTVTTIRVRYQAFTQWVATPCPYRSAHYLWGKGRNWKGKIKKATFMIDMTDLGKEAGTVYYPIFPSPRSLTKTIDSYEIRDFEPSDETFLSWNTIGKPECGSTKVYPGGCF